MAAVATAKLRQDINTILQEGDLTQLSAKKVRRQLEAKYSADLTARKQEIDTILMELMQKLEEKAASEQPEESPCANGSLSEGEGSRSEENGNGNEGSGSESDFELPADHGDVQRSKKTKKTGAEIRSDEQIAQEMQNAENTRTRSTRSGTAGTKKVRGKRKNAKSKDDEDGDDSQPKKKKKKTGYMRPLQLSSQLAEVVGTDSMARSDVVKKMWEIIRERDLLDPKNKQYMRCDAQLFKLFGRKRVRTFGMMKYLKNHILSDNE